MSVLFGQKVIILHQAINSLHNHIWMNHPGTLQIAFGSIMLRALMLPLNPYIAIAAVTNHFIPYTIWRIKLSYRQIKAAYYHYRNSAGICQPGQPAWKAYEEISIRKKIYPLHKWQPACIVLRTIGDAYAIAILLII